MYNRRPTMKLTSIPQLTFSLCLIALGAGQTALAAKPAPDAQEQARALLTGKYSSASDVKPHPLPASVVSTTSAIDGQEQARRMILGDPAKTNTAPAAASKSAAIDGQEQARRMILGGAVKTNRARAAAG
jgi:hypothetical protein